LSSADGTYVSTLVVMLPSSECLSFDFFSLVLPFHHVIVAKGLEPAVLQTISVGLFAENCLFSPSRWTVKGRTKNKD
jgi:hypothetical protein